MVSSALTYWANLNTTGVTSDAYLTQPVGVNTLDFGAHSFADLTAYNNPDGINAILQWTAVPINNANSGLSAASPNYQFGSTNYLNYSRISVSNAIAAIEGTEALSWLINNNQLQYLDANKDGIITAQEIQTFVDNSATTGNPEAGAMARLLGGNARAPASAGAAGLNAVGEQPDQPDVLQRRFNFFDYAANGSLTGGVSTAQLTMLAHNLLPSPTSFVVTDRQAASASGYLLAPTAKRNYVNLQHLLPKYEWVPKGALIKYRNISPARFHVNRGVQPAFAFPVYTLYDGPTTTTSSVVSNVKSSSSSAATTAATTTPATTTPTTTTAATTTAATTTAATMIPATTTAATTTAATATPVTTTIATTPAITISGLAANTATAQASTAAITYGTTTSTYDATLAQQASTIASNTPTG
jgi:cell division septation protein DedD